MTELERLAFLEQQAEEAYDANASARDRPAYEVFGVRRKRNGVIHLVNVRITNRVALIEDAAPKRGGRLGPMARLAPPRAS